MKRTCPITPRLAVLSTIASCLVGAVTFALPAGSVAAPSLVLHAKIKMGAPTCSPGVNSCAGVNTYGFADHLGRDFYFVYLMAAGFDTAAGVHEIEVGINYDLTSMAGVDIYGWTLCADSDSSSSADWLQMGGSNRIRWTSKGSGSLAVAGYFYVAAYNSGYLALVPPAGHDATLTPFSGEPQVIPTTALGYIGFGDNSGCNPCLANCQYVPVAGATWSSLKLLHPFR